MFNGFYCKFDSWTNAYKLPSMLSIFPTSNFSLCRSSTYTTQEIYNIVVYVKQPRKMYSSKALWYIFCLMLIEAFRTSIEYWACIHFPTEFPSKVGNLNLCMMICKSNLSKQLKENGSGKMQDLIMLDDFTRTHTTNDL